MIDLTPYLEKAINTDTLWSIGDFYIFLDILKDAGIYISHWEGEEDWANISIDKLEIGYIWRKYPFMFILSKHLDLIKWVLDIYPFLVIIKVDRLTEENFTLIFNDILINRVSSTINVKGFSANDFWFYNSI
jgi:hypothetical protein